MKKILALILTVCMILGSMAALADTDFTGTWYFLSLGLTAGTFELNADGTCALTIDSEEGEEKREGIPGLLRPVRSPHHTGRRPFSS